jgi:hypothetical protein
MAPPALPPRAGAGAGKPETRPSVAGSVASSGSGGSELEAELREDLKRFYRVVDPQKLTDEVKVNELVLWARRHGAHNLTRMMERKYGLRVEDVDDSEQGWRGIRATMARFYAKHDKSKSEAEVGKVYEWTREHGLAALNERLVSKYGLPLQSATGGVLLSGSGSGLGASSLSSPSSLASLSSVASPTLGRKGSTPELATSPEGVSTWRNKYRHLAVAQTMGNMADELRAFYAKHDPNRSQGDIDKVLAFGMQSGRAELNAILMEKYHQCLDHVKMIEGSTAEERAFNLHQRLRDFYKQHEKQPVSQDKLGALIEWGTRSYEELNAHLTRTYGFDLESRKIDPAELKAKLFTYFSIVQTRNKGAKVGSAQELVHLAESRGMGALEQELLLSYGVPFSEIQDSEDARLLAEQAPKLTRLSAARKSLTRAVAKTLGAPQSLSS